MIKSFRDKELLKNEETRMSEKFNDVQQQLMSLNETISANKALIDIYKRIQKDLKRLMKLEMLITSAWAKSVKYTVQIMTRQCFRLFLRLPEDAQ